MHCTYENLQNRHPCFGKQNKKVGRIHLPVSPRCNIACRFCNRTQNCTEKRPGVTARILCPEEAIEVLDRALELCPEITVAGIAGPGDALASDDALSTFRLIGEKYPSLLKCMSTNGLLLDEKVEEIVQVGVNSLTVTVNAVDPIIEAEINEKIVYHGEVYTGTKAAEILIENQLSGIRKVAEAGIAVKVNTVLVPGLNDKHVEVVAKTVKEAGANIYNIIPLIPQAQFKNYPAPQCKEIESVRECAEKYIPVFRHCQHCRADAVGIPGESEYGHQIYKQRLQYDETFSHG